MCASVLRCGSTVDGFVGPGALVIFHENFTCTQNEQTSAFSNVPLANIENGHQMGFAPPLGPDPGSASAIPSR